LLDNLKSLRFSSDELESLVTCEAINGHRLYVGHASRPNYLTYAVTVNGPAFSTDMAERAVVIRLTRPYPSPTWYRDTVASIETQRADIFADIRWHLEQPARTTFLDRWMPWAAEVLAVLDGAVDTLVRVNARRAEVDEEAVDVAMTVEHIRTHLRRVLDGLDPDDYPVRIPSSLLARWLCEVHGGLSPHKAGALLRQLAHPQLKPSRTSTWRGYLWVGARAPQDRPPLVLDADGKLTRPIGV
jgi:hypothetical protein